MHHITGLQNRGGWLCRGIEIWLYRHTRVCVLISRPKALIDTLMHMAVIQTMTQIVHR